MLRQASARTLPRLAGRSSSRLAPPHYAFGDTGTHTGWLTRLVAPASRLDYPNLVKEGQRRCFSVPRSTADPVFTPDEAPSFAFAFDIDGVLLHVAKPIPGAAEALRFLHDNNIPFILLTNGGGKHESERVRDLSDKLGVPLTVDNFVQSHTPFQELVHGDEGLHDKTVLITGSDAEKSRGIAEQYGFKNVIIPADILHAHPTIWPFDPLLEELYAKTARPLPKPLYEGGSLAEADALRIDAMFVFNDPRDWALDIQLITDLLLSRDGVLGTHSPKNGDIRLPNAGWQADGQPPLFFSNADLFWSTGYHQPRLGQGAFQAAVAGVWHRITEGQELQRTVFGKPFAETYRYAQRVLNAHRLAVLERHGHKKERIRPLKRVYMVGDNPESDIRGANEFRSEEGTEWYSVLVRTGVWRPGPNDFVHRPRVIVDDVRRAVDWAMEQELGETK